MKRALILGMLAAGLCGGLLAQAGAQTLKLTSPAFTHNGMIPRQYTCDGSDQSPALTIEGVPPEAKSLALIVDDPDAPVGTWVHWVVYDIPIVAGIDAGAVPGIQGFNSFRKKDYGGPCPPSGTHRYFFKLYALDTQLRLEGKVDKQRLEGAMQGHVIQQTELIGLYKR